MYTLFLAFLMSAPIEANTVELETVFKHGHERCKSPLGATVLVADGTSDWPGRAAKKIVGQLKSAFDTCTHMEVAWFGVQLARKSDLAIRGGNHDLVMLTRPAAMREAMEFGFARLIDAPRPRTMVVIAREKAYPTSVSAGSLLELARRSQVKVHTIRLAARSRRSGILRCFTRNRSQRGSGRLLEAIAVATGGKACVITGRSDGSYCVNTVIAEISRSDR
jgi:hypothetical protein